MKKSKSTESSPKEITQLETTSLRKFFTGTTCPNCKNRFPIALITQDHTPQCPKCGEQIRNNQNNKLK
jgi:Zn ribbon nucleic-acid-binding protein